MLSHKDLSIEKDAVSVLMDEFISVPIKGKEYRFQRMTLHQTDWIGKYHLLMPLDFDKIEENAIYEGNTYY